MSALPDIQVLVDWVNNPIGPNAIAGNDFTDISPYVHWVKGIKIGRGRQDNISVVQPSRCTLTLRNDDGRFTPDKSTSPYFPGVIIGRRIQVNVRDETGAWNTRFDGMLNEIDPVDTPTGLGTTVQFICTDILSFINRFPEFSCWTVQETNYQATPLLQYLMNEDSSAGVLHDSSGNNGPTLQPATYNSPPYITIPTASGNMYLASPTITFQSGQNPVEGAAEPLSPPIVTGGFSAPTTSPISSPLPSVNFEATLTNNISGNTSPPAGPSAQFQGKLGSQLVAGTGSGFTLVGWIWPDGTIYADTLMAYTTQILALSNSRTGSMLSIEMPDAGGSVNYQATYYPNYLTSSPSGTTTGGPSTVNWYLMNSAFMVAMVVNGTTVTFYVGGNIFNQSVTGNPRHVQNILLTGSTTINVPSGATFDTLSIGGPIGGGNGFFGNISLVTLYGEALTSTEINDLQQWGAMGSENQSTGTVFTRAAIKYTGIPSYWQGTVDSGLSVCDYVDITGSNPAAVIQNVQAVEHGLFFVDALGRVNFHDRSRRMGAPAPPAVTLPAGSYDPGITPKVNDQYLVNFEALQNERGGSGVVAQNTESIARYGVYPNGSVQSPQTAPYATYAATATVFQLNPPANFYLAFLYSNQNVYDAASWDVQTLGTPALKLAALTVDRLGNTPGQDEYIAPSTLYSIEIDQPVIVGQNLAWWPDGPMASELFIEGINETYSTGQAKISFYTSPAFQARAWIPGSSAYGQLDVSARVGISETVNVSGDPLVWPPTPSYSSGMNPGGGAEGFVGAYDQAGISTNLQLVTQPPLLYVAQLVNPQSAGGFTGSALLAWDTTLLDTVSGLNLSGDTGGTTYTVQVPGWYEIFATLNLSAGSGNASFWIEQNQLRAARQIAPATTRSAGSDPVGLTTSAVLWCNVGDAIAVYFTSDSPATTSTANGGSHMSMRYKGQGANRN